MDCNYRVHSFKLVVKSESRLVWIWLNSVLTLYCSALSSSPLFFSYVIEKYCCQGFLITATAKNERHLRYVIMEGNDFRRNEGLNSNVVTFTQTSKIVFFYFEHISFQASCIFQRKKNPEQIQKDWSNTTVCSAFLLFFSIH